MGWNPFKKIGRLVSKAVKSAGKAISKIPVVGSPLSSVYNIATGAPIGLLTDIASGANVGKAFVSRAKEVAHNAEAVAPYAQAVLSATGVGAVVSSGIAVGLAIAKGKPLDQAAIDAVAAGIPGGQLTTSLVKASAAVASGQRVDKAALANLPVSAAQKAAIDQALTVTAKIAKGERVDKVLVDQTNRLVKERLAPEVAKAIGVGTALGVAKQLQGAMSSSVLNNVNVLVENGRAAIAKSDVLKNVARNLPAEPFQAAIGVMQHKGVSEVTVQAIRNHYRGADRKAFDVGLATIIGGVETTKRKLDPKLSPAQLAGYYAMRGLESGSKAQRREIARVIAENPSLKAGAMKAVKDMRREKSLWGKVKEWLGLDSAA